MTVIVIDSAATLETVIIRKNDYCILVNDKVVMRTIEGNEWISDETLSQQEWDALNKYLWGM